MTFIVTVPVWSLSQRWRMSGLRRDSRNQTVRNISIGAWNTSIRLVKVMISNNELTGPKTSRNFLMKLISHRFGASTYSSSTESVGMVDWEVS